MHFYPPAVCAGPVALCFLPWRFVRIHFYLYYPQNDTGFNLFWPGVSLFVSLLPINSSLSAAAGRNVPALRG